MASDPAVEIVRAIVPVATFALGAFTNAVLDSRRDGRTAQREERAAHRQLELDRQRQADAFQRETLLELQDALRATARQTSLAHMEALRHERAGGQPAALRLSDDIETALLEEGHNLNRLTQRVLDDELREAAWGLARSLDLVTMYGINGQTYDESERRWQAAATEYERVSGLLGAAIRRLFPAGAATHRQGSPE